MTRSGMKKSRTGSGEYEIRLLDTTSDLRACAAAWDRLWSESEVTSPSARAEIVSLWADTFAASTQFRALVVAQGERFVGALPLVGKRFLKSVIAGKLPCNDWAASGDLLLAEDCDREKILEMLVSAIPTLPWRVMVLEHIALDQPRWIAFRDAVQRAGLSTTAVPQHQVAQVQVGNDWSSYEASRKSRHRQRRRRNARMLERAGSTDFRIFNDLPPDQVDQLMQRGFQVEDRSWKGRAETSVLKNPEVFQYYIEEARKLADWGQLELAFLEHEGTPIAFYYGWNAKGVRYSVKLGYDQEFAKFGPGQQQCMRILERAHDDPDCNLYDFYGPLMPWNESWATDTYEVSRVIVAPRRSIEKVLFDLYGYLHPALKRFRQKIRSFSLRSARQQK